MNITENAFNQLVQILEKKRKSDLSKGKEWPRRSAGAKAFWKRQIRAAVREFDKDKSWFSNAWDSYLDRHKDIVKQNGGLTQWSVGNKNQGPQSCMMF